MSKLLLKILCCLLTISFLAGCAVQKAAFKPYDLNAEFKSGRYIKNIDNFLVILDASISMSYFYNEQRKIDIAQDTISHMNATIPDLKFTGGVRTFGNVFLWFEEKTDMLYGLTEHKKQDLENSLAKVTTGGQSPLYIAIDKASEDLASVKGKSAIIIFSDGDELGDAPIKSAELIKNKYGDNVCIYTVLIGGSGSGKQLLEQVASAGGCGFSVSADNISSAKDMSDFVKKVFLKECPDSDLDGVNDCVDKCADTPKGATVDANGCPLDTDEDGVFDYMDKCPDTPKGVKVDANGCPFKEIKQKSNVKTSGLDSDGDGIYDVKDKCPNTPKGAHVNEVGCWILKDINFDFNKSDIKPEFYKELDDALSVMRENPNMRVEIQGHTDKVGSKKYNQALSEKRAKAVMMYFIEKGIEKGKISAKGFGFAKPVAPNKTQAGRDKNRRVELKPIH
ncbi:MAG: OmpA family protein [Desulfobacterales bacterium]|nr:OmpA family protein [Desulfobacterales bacterium]